MDDEGGLRVRYLRSGGTLLYLAGEATVGDPAKWRAISLTERKILDIVAARIVWISRSLAEEL